MKAAFMAVLSAGSLGNTSQKGLMRINDSLASSN